MALCANIAMSLEKVTESVVIAKVYQLFRRFDSKKMEEKNKQEEKQKEKQGERR